MREDSISDAWSESRIDKPKKYNMPIWLTDEDFDYIVLAPVSYTHLTLPTIYSV